MALGIEKARGMMLSVKYKSERHAIIKEEDEREEIIEQLHA